ncbi:MAG: hypothetical protein ACKVQK_28375 [Burkholderiales bacterium]
MALHLECVPEPEHRFAAKVLPAIGEPGFVLDRGNACASADMLDIAAMQIDLLRSMYWRPGCINV